MSSEAEFGRETTSPVLEFLRVAALLGIFAGQLFLASIITKRPLDYCLTRPFWLDEIHTAILVNENRADQLLFKLSQGADGNPPGLHFVLWLISKVTSVSDEFMIRTFSCTVGVGGLVSVYFLLRVRFPWRVSWVAVLGMWSSSPQLVQQMFEGRPYSFWFASIAILCLLLSLPATGVWHTICAGAIAALMCVIHYFGIIGLVLIAATQFCCNFREIHQRRLIGAAITGGVIGLIVSLPIYFSQRAALPNQSWVPPPTVSTSIAFVEEFILTYALTLPILTYAFQILLRLGSDDSGSKNGVEFASYAGACALILLPVVLVVLSYLIQPVLVTRYAVPATLAYAPLIALVSNRLNRGMLQGMALCFFIVGLRGALVVYELRPDFHEAAPLINASTVDRPLIVHWRVIAYPLFRYSGCQSDVVGVSYLFRGNRLSRFDEWEHAFARRMAELFDVPKTLETQDLASRDEFHLLAIEGEERRYEGWTAERLDVSVGPLQGYRMRRSAGASPLKTPATDDATAR